MLHTMVKMIKINFLILFFIFIGFIDKWKPLFHPTYLPRADRNSTDIQY